MTEQQKEGTRIIAEFLQWDTYGTDNYWIPSAYPLPEDIGHTLLGIECCIFHTSFDWLMPVYVKFRKLIILNNWRDREVENMVSSLWYVVIDKLCNGEPAPLFIAMVDLLKYYNEEKK